MVVEAILRVVLGVKPLCIDIERAQRERDSVCEVKKAINPDSQLYYQETHKSEKKKKLQYSESQSDKYR